MSGSSLLFPSIQGGPGGNVIQREPQQAREVNGTNTANLPEANSFSQILGREFELPIQEPLKFSAHASQRLQSRNLNLGPEQMRKLNEAVDKAASKGLDETLILTKEAAFIVSVKNRTVVTAMDKNALDGNVFTNIEGAVIVN